MEEKGFDYLFQAIPLVRARCPEAHFVYAGEINVVYENFFERCRPLMEAHRDAITSLGLILSSQQMANFYAMCDLFVLPSRSDCFPSVQIEALLSGTPLVTTDIPGAREVVQVTGLGRLVAPRDPQALADGIVAMLAAPPPRPTRAQVRRIFSTERSLDEYEGVMERLVRGKQLERMLCNEADMAFKRRMKAILEYLDIQDGERVLDCGCGLGFHLMVMGELYQGRLTGLDRDLMRLRKAQHELDGKPIPLTTGDICRLPYASHSFDKILLSEVLEHLPDDKAALKEVLRILKPGGVVAITVPHKNYPFWWDPINKTREFLSLSPIRQGLFGGIWTDHVRLYTPETLQELISGNGLVIEDMRVFTHYCFPFSHNLVYGIGKPLVESGLLAGADRFRYKENSGSWLNPVHLGLRLFNFIDRFNEDLSGKKTFVSISVKARKTMS